SAGWGRRSCTVTSSSPLALTSATFLYQSCRGFLRKESFDLPISRSKVHLTSLAVNVLPSCHFTPWRSLNVSMVLSSLHDQLSVRSGTIESKLFWGTFRLYRTRLLKNGMNGITVEYVASS